MSTAPVIPIVEPYTPELLSQVADRIERFLSFRRQPKVLELGSGWSTIWFSLIKKDLQLLSLEHDEDWYEEVRLTFQHAVQGRACPIILTIPQMFPCLMQQMRREYYDLIYIDCIDEQRTACTYAALSLLKKDGWLVLDDTHWALWTETIDGLTKMGYTMETYRGNHKRKDKSVQFHQTSIMFKE